MKKLTTRIICIIISLLSTFPILNAFGREEYITPKVIISSSNIYYIKGDSSLWKYNTYKNTQQKILDDVVYIGEGSAHLELSAIQSDGTLYSYWSGYDENQFEFDMSDVAYATSFSMNDGVQLRLKKDGRLFIKGSDMEERYVLGLGNIKNAETPTQIMENVDTVYASNYNAVALKNDGSLWAWGVSQKKVPENIAQNIISLEAVTYDSIYALENGNKLWAGFYYDDNNFCIKPSLIENVKKVSVSQKYSGVRQIAYIDTDDSLHLGFIDKTDIFPEGDILNFKKVMSDVKDVIMTDYDSLVGSPVAIIKKDNSLWITTKYNAGGNQYIPLETDFVKIMDNVECATLNPSRGAIITKDGNLHLFNFSVKYIDGVLHSDVDGIRIIDQTRNFNSSEWATEEINRALSLNIIPQRMQSDYKTNISRINFCELLTKTIEAKTGKSIESLLKEKGSLPHKNFIDIKSDYVDYMSCLGIVNGKSETLFSPYSKITREEAAVMLTRAAEFLGYDTTYQSTVEPGISSWATDGVGFVTENGIMNGTGNGFAPQGKYTKEQAIATFVRMYDNLK